jgi:UDP-glucose 4-epimerase
MSSKLQKVVITGHCGFIGSYVYRHYKDIANVVGIDIKAPHPIDIRDFGQLSKACQDADLIIHLAAVSSYKACEDNVATAITTNVDGTKNVFEVARLNNAKVIFASSAAVYGKQDFPAAEYFSPAPVGAYAATKLRGETIATEYMSKGVCSTICRFFNVYGHGANPEYAGVITKFIQSTIKREPIHIHGTGTQQRDFIYIKDVVEIIDRVHKRMEYPKWPLKLNVGTGQGTSISALSKVICGFTGSPFKPLHLPAFDSGVEYSVADTSILRNELKIVPRNIVMGLEDMFNE